MPSSASPTFDPYHKWLGIRDYAGSPNHYRLLGLELFEADDEVIRDAAARQTTHLRTYRNGSQREICERIVQEVLQAKSILLDAREKAAYDRELKLHGHVNQTRAPSSFSAAGGKNGLAGQLSQSTPSAPSFSVECHQCRIENLPGRQFCASCGAPLWQPCLDCGRSNAANEKHCGGCGANLAAQLQRAQETLAAELDEIEALAADSRHDESIDRLLAVEVAAHSGLAAYRDRVSKRIAELRAEIVNNQQQCESALARGRELFDACDYEQASIMLESVLEPYRTDELRQLIDEVRNRQVDVLTLEADIGRAVAEKRTAGLLAKVNELLRLKPDHLQARALAEKLRPLEHKKKLGECELYWKSATDLLSCHDYAGALARLEQIDKSVRTPRLVKLIEDTKAKAAETAWLARDLQEAVVYDEHLLDVAGRLSKLRPNDNEVRQMVARLATRAAANGSHHNGKPSWPTPPQTSVWGPPLSLVERFQRIDVSPLDKTDRFRADRFCVAAGLALQGLEQAAININLAPPEKSGMLAVLLKGKKKPPAVAWGIDVGRCALKAIKLRYDAEKNSLAAEAAEYIEHSTLLNATDTQAEATLAQSLAKFFARDDLKNVPLCVSIPGQKVLSRSVALPLVDEKRIGELMKFEVRHQILFPLEEVVWGYQVLSQRQTEVAVVRECAAVLLALKQDEARAAVAPFTAAGLKVAILQSDAAALFNFVMYDCAANDAALKPSLLGRAQGEGQQDRAFGSAIRVPQQKVTTGTADDIDPVTVALDVGTDSSNLLVTNGRALSMRSIPLGGNTLSRMIVKEFQLTFAQAERVKRNPSSVRELSRLFAVLEPRFADLAAEIERSIDTFLQAQPARRVARFIVVGGGLKLHGALRRLWHGE
jgi:type IV pilus assembly protein PilM